MAKPDYAHRMTDKQLAELESRIADLYKQAADELSDTITAYFKQFEKRDAEMQEKVKAGAITEQDYKQWRLAQIGRGKRYEALRDKVAERYSNANEVALAYANDATPGIYTLNRNYAAYTIEQVSDSADFTLWDEQTVKRLIKNPEGYLLYYPPERKLNSAKDIAYEKKQISASVTSGILQGKSVYKIADDLQDRLQGMNRSMAVRTARTVVTGAQNAGRMESYAAAEKMGIKVKKQWLATLDNRTRHAHALLNGQTAETDKPFEVEGYKIMFPGDASAPAFLVENCRCTLIAAINGIDTSGEMRRARDPVTGESVLVKNMTYSEWEVWKKESVAIHQKTTLNGLNLKSMEDCKRELLNGVGFDLVEDSFIKNVDEKLAIESTKQLYKLEQTFGAIKQSTGSICSVSQKGSAAYVSAKIKNPTEQNLSLCPAAYANYESHINQILSEINSGFAMPALKENAAIYTVTHEYGHMVQNVFVKKAMEDYGIEKLEASVDYKKNTAKAVFRQYYKIQAETEKKCCAEILDIAKEDNVDFKLSDNISRYGKTNYAEFFAEAFANSQLGAPNEIGKAMQVWLERNILK